ncbi:hypothetical protein [Rubrivirga sp. IMCC43871]|uniref:hypothetical protein n=1 Tax=Rubrivirga sp. IMCC43871 TaxID=3391575 RepID=UPI00398FB4B4
MQTTAVAAIALVALLCSASASGQVVTADTTLDLAALPPQDGWAIFNRTAESHSEPGRETAVYLDEKSGQGVAWVPGLSFGDGVIEVDVRGRNTPGRSFVGLAFHGTRADQYEAVYLRPFNFRAEDPDRRSHAVQYVAVPSHEWSRLRTNHPGQYEAAIAAPPDPDGWVHLRIELDGPSVRVFVDGAPEPTLAVDRIGTSERGWVGLWVGSGSDGTFANLTLSPM